MEEHSADGSTTCEACLDWRIEQSRSMGTHVAALVRAIVSELGVDVEDEDVRAVIANSMREYGAGIDGP